MLLELTGDKTENSTVPISVPVDRKTLKGKKIPASLAMAKSCFLLTLNMVLKQCWRNNNFGAILFLPNLQKI